MNFIAEQERNHNAPSSTMLSTTVGSSVGFLALAWRRAGPGVLDPRSACKVMFEQRADKKEEGLYEGLSCPTLCDS